MDVLLSLLSESDSELLSGEKILFFFNVFASAFVVLGIVFEIAFDLAPVAALGGNCLALASTAAAFLGLVDRLLGGAGFGVGGLGISSSLDEDGLGLDERLGFGSSAGFGSSTGAGLGDLGAGAGGTAGISDVEDSESELLDPDPELVDEVPLVLESDVEPELLSVLLLLTCNRKITCIDQ